MCLAGSIMYQTLQAIIHTIKNFHFCYQKYSLVSYIEGQDDTIYRQSLDSYRLFKA